MTYHPSMRALVLLIALFAPTLAGAEPSVVLDEARAKVIGKAIVLALARRDLAALAEHTGDHRYLYFTPYAGGCRCVPPTGGCRACSLDDESSKRPHVRVQALPTLMTDRTVREMGSWDGSGEPIRMRFATYYRRFIYDRDYAHESMKVWRRGTSTFVGVRSSGESWRELILVFHGEHLSAILHNEWTI